MKKITQVVNELCSYKHYKPLKNYFECEKFIKTLRNDIRQNLLLKTSRIYIFDDSLVINAKNNACLQDLVLESNKKMLKDSLLLYQKLANDDTLKNIKHIKYTIDKYNNNKKLNTYTIDDFFTEHSDGEFVNILKNEKAKKTLDEIKKQIKKNIKK